MTWVGAGSRFVSLRVLYLIMIRVLGWLLLPGRGQAPKDAEIMVLRHEATALSRQVARLLPSVLRDHRLVTPGTLLAWHSRLPDHTQVDLPEAARPPRNQQADPRLVLRLARENRA
jgi:putative transposase